LMIITNPKKLTVKMLINKNRIKRYVFP